MQDLLVNKIQSGKLVPYGYPGRTKTDLTAIPVEIPVRFVEKQSVDWERNIISAPPRRFYSVRIARLAKNIVSAIAPSDSGKSPRRGRRPSIHLIVPVIHNAIAQGLLTGKSEKQVVALIQRLSREQNPTAFPTSANPSPNTVRKALRLHGPF
jgi:hypothetical protein